MWDFLGILSMKILKFRPKLENSLNCWFTVLLKIKNQVTVETVQETVQVDKSSPCCAS